MAENENENETTEEQTPVEAEAETEASPVEETAAAEAPAEETGAAEAPAEETPGEETAAAEAPAEEQAAPAPQQQSGPKPKRKRLPRALRPQKGRRLHVPSAERRPISRLPKPEHERGRHQERRGVVVSDAMDKTIVVKVDVIRSHPRYKKVIRRSVKFHAHDEQNAAHVGDTVRIVETRPLSKTKRWRLVEVLEVAK
jgi:small subunit ribosomal protein S17